MNFLKKTLITATFTAFVTLNAAKKEWQVFPKKHDSKKAYNNLADLNGDFNKSTKKGFIIVTTNDLTHELKKLQKYIDCKAKFRGFNVFLATESDFDVKTAENVKRAIRLGEPYGRIRQYQIYNYLRDVYKKLNLRYVLFIGHSHPDVGDVPMIYSGGNYSKADPNGKFVRHQYQSPSDFPYCDLDTDYNHKKDSYFNLDRPYIKEALKKGIDRTPEVLVGRVPYYGEESAYGKAEDVDAILERFIRYDTEKDIAWRYNFMVTQKVGQEKDRALYEKNGLNYNLVGRHIGTVSYDFPGLKGRTGGALANWEKIQDYPVGMFGEHSHGNARGMNGLSSRHFAAKGHDKWPTVLTLGACDIGHIEDSQNLIYTLLRFQSIAASGGTRSVTTYGGNSRYVKENGLGKSMRLLKGESVGSAHWGWYGSLFKTGSLSGTASRINLYGDPSLVPFRYGMNAPYKFQVRPIAGVFNTYENAKSVKASKSITVENNNKKAVTLVIESSESWLKPSISKIELKPNSKAKVKLAVTRLPDAEKSYTEAKLTVKDEASGFTVERRVAFKKLNKELVAFTDFEVSKEATSIINKVTGPVAKGGHGSKEVFSTKYFKWLDGYKTLMADIEKGKIKKSEVNQKKLKAPESPFVKGKEGLGFSLQSDELNVNYEVLKEAGITISFWVKYTGNVKKRKTLLSSNSLTLDVSPNTNKISGKITNLDLGLGGKVQKDFDFDYSLEQNKWYFFTLELNQNSGQLNILVDAQNVGTVEVPKKQFYDFSGIRFSKWLPAILDDFQITAQNLTSSELNSYYKSSFLTPLAPKTKSSGLAQDTVEFDFLVGSKVKNPYVALVQNKKIVKKIKKDKSSRYIAYDLKPNSIYQWQVQSDDGFKSPIQAFKTGNQLIPNSKFMKTHAVWKDAKKGSPIAIKDEQLVIPSNTIASVKVPVSAGKYYEFETDFAAGQKTWTAKVDIAAPGKVLSSEKINIRRATHKKLFFKVPQGVSNVSVNISNGEERNKKWSTVNLNSVELKMVPRSKVNFAPVIYKKNFANYVEDIEIGAIGHFITLTDFVKDPEGKALRFVIVDAPRWFIIQEDQLMSPFGPPKGTKSGEIVEVSLRAIDLAGNATPFTVKFRVK